LFNDVIPADASKDIDDPLIVVINDELQSGLTTNRYVNKLECIAFKVTIDIQAIEPSS
jgi:hypothetical protein